MDARERIGFLIVLFTSALRRRDRLLRFCAVDYTNSIALCETVTG